MLKALVERALGTPFEARVFNKFLDITFLDKSSKPFEMEYIFEASFDGSGPLGKARITKGFLRNGSIIIPTNVTVGEWSKKFDIHALGMEQFVFGLGNPLGYKLDLSAVKVTPDAIKGSVSLLPGDYKFLRTLWTDSANKDYLSILRQEFVSDLTKCE